MITKSDAILIIVSAKRSTTMYWSMLEVGSSIIAACLPTLWPLVNHQYFSKLGSTLRNISPSWHRRFTLPPDSSHNAPPPTPPLPKVEEEDEDEDEGEECLDAGNNRRLTTNSQDDEDLGRT